MKRSTLIGVYVLVAILVLAAIPQVRRAVLYAHEDAMFSLDKSPERAFALGEKYFNADGGGHYDIKRARHFYYYTLYENPSHPLVYLQIARTSFVSGMFDNALIEVNHQIEKYGDQTPSAYYVRALIYGFQQEHGKAAVDFEKYIALVPEKWFSYNDVAWSYMQNKEFEKALVAVDKGLVIDPENAWLLVTKSAILVELGRYEEARPIAERSVAAAAKITPQQWQEMYPGNDPALTAEGIATMIETSKANLQKIEARFQ